MAILKTILNFLVPILAQAVLAFIQSMKENRLDDKDFMSFLEDIIVMASKKDWTGEQKITWVRDYAKEYLVDMGRDVKDSALNALIETSLLRLKSAGTIA